MQKIKLDHVERLSRGKRSGANIGSRSVGHNLRPHERASYQRALSKGYLDITTRDRPNLWHVWEKACAASEWEFLVLMKDLQTDSATIYRNGKVIQQQSLAAAKLAAQQLAQVNKETN